MSRTIVTLLCKVNFIIIIIQTALVCGQDHSHTPVLGARPSASCYNDLGLPQRCLPEFENAAYGVQMEATNTCGENGEIRYCIQTGTSTRKSCDVCTRDQFQSYYLTDLHHELDNQTWWQSETMNEGIQYPNQVNLTLHLGKAYDITYVRVVFYSPRPESFSIYKRTKEDGEWVPYQYYSASCRETYGLLDSSSAPRGAETMALCTSEYSDISPLRGGNVAFSTLEGRPSAFSFEFSPELQEWVTATDLRITLDRLNTFGDELFGDQQVMQSYWYAVADVAVGARCKCNGHASRCEGVEGSRRCVCEHRTAGRDCEKCEDFYNDAPWGRASQSDVHECKACNCNGFSDRCYFDKDLYERTGHGGHCLQCNENRDGPNCEHCKENFYQREDNVCISCNCNATGSRSLQCNSEGRCQCKPGVIGEKCDQCAPNHYEFTNQGCSPCGCSDEGSFANMPQCDPYTGVCYCKENVEGKRCRECKPGFFNLDRNNEFGCTPCFCYGHSSECRSASDYSQVSLESMFVRGPEKWTGQDDQHNIIPLKYNAMTQNVALAAQGNEQLYFIAPDRFLGDQRASYNHDLKFTLRIGEENPYASSADVILEGAGNYVSINIFGQENREPGIQNTEYTFRLNEHPDYGWSPKLSAFGFLSILSNLTAIRIRGTYTPGGKGFIDNFKLETARRGTAGVQALWVEMCSCPEGYVGQFCESCAPGYRHSPASKGPFMPCIPCECNGHAKICDSETGLCICEHNTGGDNCELCARGYYGNALSGNENDCTKCPCPLHGACIQMADQTIVCTECPTGYAGIRCDLCADGYFVAGQDGSGGVVCRPCDCNLNVDLNAVGNCNRTSGECLKCIYNTAGEHCDRCLNGFYGNALAPTKGDCRPCECYSVGTLESEAGPPLCDPLSGQCACRPHVTGRNCDKCQEGYYKIMSGEGCQACDCNLEGSYNNTCQLVTGQCHCKPGVTGLHCDQCKPYYYGFSSNGCTACDCDQHGSTSEQCDRNGQCPCQENVEGRRCDRCKENKHNREGQNGCEDCPACYNLVQDAVNQHRHGLAELQGVLLKISKDPTVVQNSDFDVELASAKSMLDGLVKNAADASGIGDGEKSLVQKVDELNDRLDHVRDLLDNVEKSTEEANVSGKEGAHNVKNADAVIEEARKEWNLAWDNLQNDGAAALAKAQNRSDQFGQQSTQMSVIAQEARMIAESLEKEALNIRQVAENAYNTSLDAYKLAKDGIGQQTNISNELLILTGDIVVAGNTLKTVQNLTSQALARAVAAYNNALDIYAEVNSTNIANFDAAEIQKHAAVMIKEADNVQNKANRLNEEHKDMLAALENQINKARDLLQLGIDRQEDLQDIFSRLDEIRAKAERAVKETNSTLQDALTIHDTLKQFSNQVQESRQRAENEIKQIPKIKETVDRAKEMTLMVINDLEEAGGNAKSARDIAQEAQNKYAQAASQEAHEIRKKAAATRLDAGKLHDEANKLSGRVAETARQIEILEARAEDDATMTNDAKIKVGQAKTDASEAQKLVKKAMQDVMTITEELKNLPLLNDNALDTLEQHLEEAERELKKADLGGKIQTLQAARNTHQRWAKDYQDEAEKLAAEVDNVKDILDALPDGCFKRLNLEP